jgi:hypothetical protein
MATVADYLPTPFPDTVELRIPCCDVPTFTDVYRWGVHTLVRVCPRCGRGWRAVLWPLRVENGHVVCSTPTWGPAP